MRELNRISVIFWVAFVFLMLGVLTGNMAFFNIFFGGMAVFLVLLVNMSIKDGKIAKERQRKFEEEKKLYNKRNNIR